MENGSETVENDQTGLPLWAAALTAQMQTAFAGPVKAHRAELQELVEECRASAHNARLAKAQLQDQRDEIEALQERTRVEAAERSTPTAEQAQAARRGASGQAIDFGDGSETPAERGLQAPLAPPGPPPKGATNRAAVRDHFDAQNRPGNYSVQPQHAAKLMHSCP